MQRDRTLESIPVHDGRAVIPASTPERICRNIGILLGKCTLPPPFRKGISPRVVPWSPKLQEDEITFPTIAWQIVHTIPMSERPQPTYVRTETHSTAMQVAVYQQDFNNTIDFHVYASTQEEAGELHWWLIDQLYTYRQTIADWGSQHFRFSEARPDFLASLGTQKYPMRTARYTMISSRVYYVPRTVLTKLTISAYDTNTLTPAVESVVKGTDTLQHPYVAMIALVTSPDGSITYAPSYHHDTQQLVWATNEPQPADGETYAVHYLYYGSAAVEVIDAPPT